MVVASWPTMQSQAARTAGTYECPTFRCALVAAALEAMPSLAAPHRTRTGSGENMAVLGIGGSNIGHSLVDGEAVEGISISFVPRTIIMQ